MKYILVVFFLLQALTGFVQAYEPVAGLKHTSAQSDTDMRCVYRNSNSGANGLGDWVTDDCDYVGAHFACYNGSRWEIAQALGTVDDAGEPQDGDTSITPNKKAVDRWDPITGDNTCKNYFGPSFFFSVPINEEEDIALGIAIANMVAAKKRTWLYYYSRPGNNLAVEKHWFGSRTEYANWLGNNPDNQSSDGDADCILLDRTTGYWQDESCSAEYPFACLASGDWELSTTIGQWRDGFATCNTNYSNTGVYAVPRDEDENTAIINATPSTTATGINFDKVWLNQTDLAFEEFFISNQTRQSWWAEGQPSNRNNADCTLVNSVGEWVSASCDLTEAYHACYIGDSSAEGQWLLSNALDENSADNKFSGRAISSYGFGYCKRLADNAEYRAPNSANSNAALAGEVMKLGVDALVWVNFSDQRREGAWQVVAAYQDFESATPLADDNNDCAYYSSQTNDEGNWVAGPCFAGGISMGFACTNGYEWKLVSHDAQGISVESELWKDGFDLCPNTLGADYYFAGPSSADDNSRLALALSLSGETQAWINVNDATNEGIWVANGPSVNLAPSLTLPTNLVFNEQEEIDLTVIAIDPENEGIANYSWRIIETRIGENDTGLDNVITPTFSGGSSAVEGALLSNITITPTTLLNDPYFIDVQLQVTDAAEPPTTTTAIFTLKVLPPLKAAYNFDTYTNPRLDWTGNGHDLILNTSEVRITDKTGERTNYYAKMDASDVFEIDGSISGLQVGSPEKDEYTVVYSFKIDEFPAAGTFSNFWLKGTDGGRQPGLYLHGDRETFYYSALGVGDTPGSNNINTNLWGVEQVRLGQWFTGAYVKTPTQILAYLDKTERKETDPVTPMDLRGAPDGSINKDREAVYVEGNWQFGNTNSTRYEGFVGGIDDIRIYNRALTAAELGTLFPTQAKGRFEFNQAYQETEESADTGGIHTLMVNVERIEGDDGEVAVAYALTSGTAELGVDFKLLNADTDADAAAGIGRLTWGVHDRDAKQIIVQILADDLREGTESFTIELEQILSLDDAVPSEPEVAENNVITINILDRTPNIYGAIEFAMTTPSINSVVNEGDDGYITIERFGTNSLGAVDLWYTVTEFSAIHGTDFAIGQIGFNLADRTTSGKVVGTGIIKFAGASPAAAVATAKTVKEIFFTTERHAEVEQDKLFFVTLDKLTDPGSATLANPDESAILGGRISYGQVIRDVAAGRVRFKQADSGFIDEDLASSNRTVTLELERVNGTIGAFCIGFGFSGDGITTADYEFNSQFHTGNNDDVYWADGDSEDKNITITAQNDQAYEALENLVITIAPKTSCDYDSTSGLDPVAQPDSPLTSDNVSTTVAINDQTHPIQVTFSTSQYLTTEQNAPVLAVTVYADQPASTLDNTATRSNRTAFDVFLSRTTTGVTAIEGVHYGDLTAQQVVHFNAGETSKVISIPIVDNCDAADSLSFGLEMTVVDVDGIAVSNPGLVADGILDLGGASTTISIANYSAVPGVVLGYHYDGIVDTTLRADWNVPNNLKDSWNTAVRVTSQISSAQRTPEATQMGMKATVDHNCAENLRFQWQSADNTSPVLPTVASLPSFSIMPLLRGVDRIASGSSTLYSDLFSLPFIIQQNTNWALELVVTDPEIRGADSNSRQYTKDEMSSLGHSIVMKQSYRRIKAGYDSKCVRSIGSGKQMRHHYCDQTTGNQQFAYNFATKQLVQHHTAAPLCIAGARGGRIYTQPCVAPAGVKPQEWNINNVNANGFVSSENNNYRMCTTITAAWSWNYPRLLNSYCGSYTSDFSWDTYGVGSGG